MYMGEIGQQERGEKCLRKIIKRNENIGKARIKDCQKFFRQISEKLGWFVKIKKKVFPFFYVWWWVLAYE